jgi:translation initiation factor 1
MALVYSIAHGCTCPGCRQPLEACVCKAAKSMPAGDGIVRVSRENQGRGGKSVTVVQGDHVERLMAWLTQAGHRVRRAGV